MNLSITTTAEEAGRAAKAAYLEEHPEPQARDFACPWCYVAPGHPCDSPLRNKVERSHLPRQGRMIRARDARFLASDNAYDKAYDAVLRTPKDAS